MVLNRERTIYWSSTILTEFRNLQVIILSTYPTNVQSEAGKLGDVNFALNELLLGIISSPAIVLFCNFCEAAVVHMRVHF